MPTAAIEYGTKELYNRQERSKRRFKKSKWSGQYGTDSRNAVARDKYVRNVQSVSCSHRNKEILLCVKCQI